ncbi:MAG: hypothetical protein J6X44_04065 [Thermoguttaceae bacterium]|nr:hypothetical protein [Thermoguttaceae bacterium]
MPLRRSILALALCVTALAFAFDNCSLADESNSQYAYQEAIVADWIRQERDFGRELSSKEALLAAVARGREFAEWASGEDWIDVKESQKLQELLRSDEQYLDGDGTPVETIQRYLELRQILRNLALANPEVSGRPIIFLQEERFVWQMLHEFLSYYYQECGMNGGGIYKLKEPGRSFEVESLTDGKFPKGVFETLSLSYDGKTAYFAFADFSKVQPDDMPETDIRTLQAGPYI